MMRQSSRNPFAIFKSLQPGNKAIPSLLSSNAFMVTELMPSARIQCTMDRHRHYHLLPRKSKGSGEIEAKQVKDQLPFSASVPSRSPHAPPLTATVRHSRVQNANTRSQLSGSQSKLRPEPPARFPGAPALPRVPWDRPIHVAAGQPMGQRARGIPLQDA